MHFQFRQPPLLSAMVQAIYNRTGDLELVKNALPALLKEYQFWNSELDIAFLAKVVGDNAEFIGSFSIKKSNDQIWILE
ncbi:hypothetical protein LWI28_024380 [Acer negundo]|uniref:alpha,alpha-trehalase n=1 Tax=Acer negundo TaxID=4023 RepID=A0AAD5NP61_ACENE|nr:hypothetical protein LWI28_024380 [Acer negundo]